MYLEKRPSAGGTKLYYSHTFRHFGHVRKVVVYLGLNLSDEQIEAKKKAAESEIEAKVSHYLQSQDPFYTEAGFDPQQLQGIKIPFKVFRLRGAQWKSFARLFTYHTNAIEGSSLGPEQVNAVLDGKKIDADKDDIHEAIGLNKAVESLKDNHLPFSVQTMKGLHHTVFSKSKPFAGKFRTVDVVVTNSFGEVVHRGMYWPKVEKAMEELAVWYANNRKKLHPIVLAAVTHNRFEEIHPFQDGNGRVGRLMLNLALLQNGFPPVNIELENRGPYYSALNRYSKRRDVRPMIKFLLREYKKMAQKLGVTTKK